MILTTSNAANTIPAMHTPIVDFGKYRKALTANTTDVTKPCKTDLVGPFKAIARDFAGYHVAILSHYRKSQFYRELHPLELTR